MNDVFEDSYWGQMVQRLPLHPLSLSLSLSLTPILIPQIDVLISANSFTRNKLTRLPPSAVTIILLHFAIYSSYAKPLNRQHEFTVSSIIGLLYIRFPARGCLSCLLMRIETLEFDPAHPSPPCFDATYCFLPLPAWHARLMSVLLAKEIVSTT